MSSFKVVIKFRNVEQMIYGLPYENVKTDVELTELLKIAAEKVNTKMNNPFCFVCCFKRTTTEKWITKEEIQDFRIFSDDQRESLNQIVLRLALPGEKEKMDKVYAEFLNVLHLYAKTNSYLLF